MSRQAATSEFLKTNRYFFPAFVVIITDMTDALLKPIFTTRGALGGFLAGEMIFSPTGDWIGWVSADHQVYSVHGHWVGVITSEPRIIRKRENSAGSPALIPQRQPPAVQLPARVGLPPMLPELRSNMIDVLDEMPELMPCIDYGELRKDMD